MVAKKHLAFTVLAAPLFDAIVTDYIRERDNDAAKFDHLASEFTARKDLLHRRGRVPGEVSNGELRAFPIELADGLIWMIFIEDSAKYWILHVTRVKRSRLQRGRSLVPTDRDWAIAEDRLEQLGRRAG